MVNPLFANEDFLSDKVITKVEAGLFLPKISGSVLNVSGEGEFEKDFKYKDSSATYLSVSILLDYDYIPNIDISYFNMKDNKSTTLDRNLTVADGDFNSSVATVFDYQVATATLFQDFKIKGDYIPFFGYGIYSGDLEFDMGLSTKLVLWNFEVKDLTLPATHPSSWINVKQLITLPYLGVKYYLYDFLLHADVNALSFSRAKSVSYEAGIDYRVVSGLYLSGSYMFEEFKADEKGDTVTFGTSGYKLSFKYAF